LEDFYAKRYYSKLTAAARQFQSNSSEDMQRLSAFGEAGLSELDRIRIERKVKKFREKFRSNMQIEDTELFYAPYWHIDGIVANGYLGRYSKSGLKSLLPRFYQLEFTAPGYNEEHINLRDQGLRIAGSDLTMLQRGQVLEDFPYLVPTGVGEELFQQAEFWFNRIPWDEIKAIQYRARFIHRKVMLVFKPFWIVKYKWDHDHFVQLLDGVFNSVAGNLVYEKDMLLPSFIEKEKPIYPEGDMVAKILPSECPVCNHEQHYKSDECIHFCNNCYRALELTNGKIKEMEYYTVREGLTSTRDKKTLFLPFWAIEAYIVPENSNDTFTLGSYINKIGEELKGKPGFLAKENMFFIPALKYFGGFRIDEMFCKIVKELSWSEKQIIPEKINLDMNARFMGATLTSEETLEMIPFLIYSLLDKPTEMRMNKLTVLKYLENITIHTDTTYLVMIPFHEHYQHYTNPLLSFNVPKTFIGGTWVKEWIRTSYFRRKSES